MTREQVKIKRIDTFFKIQHIIDTLKEKNDNSGDKEKTIARLYKKQSTLNMSMLILDEIVFGAKDVAATYRANKTNADAIKLAMSVLLKSKKERYSEGR